LAAVYEIGEMLAENHGDLPAAVVLLLLDICPTGGSDPSISRSDFCTGSTWIMIDKESDALEQQEQQQQLKQAHCSHVRADQAVVARSGPAMLRTSNISSTATATSNGNGQLNLAPSAGRGFGAIERTKFRGQECKRLYFGFFGIPGVELRSLKIARIEGMLRCGQGWLQRTPPVVKYRQMRPGADRGGV
jgi:hypothetical protein